MMACNTRKQKSTQVDPALLNITELAPKPPMGWNSWNCFGTDVTEKEVKENIDYMAARLKPYGWEYIVVDLGWYLPPGITVRTFKQTRPPQHIDKYGRLIPDTLKFPSSARDAGFKPLADYAHARGLKFGIHIMRGIPWQAMAHNLPVKGTDYRAADIANPKDTCVWYDGMEGVDMTKPGAQEYYNSLIELYAQWGVDFIKADDMSSPYRKQEIQGLSTAIKISGHPVVLSLSPGAAPVEEHAHLLENANMWRISPDFWDDWKFLKRQFDLCRIWYPKTVAGHWPDCDMLPLGKLRKTGPDDYVCKEMGKTHLEITNEYSRFTNNEKITLMTLWCIFRSPLMMGGNLPETDAFSLKLLTNGEAININQNSKENRELKAEDGKVVWTARSADDKAIYLAFFNTSEKKQAVISVAWSELGIGGRYKVRDVWNDKIPGTFKESFSATIDSHGAGLFRLTAE